MSGKRLRVPHAAGSQDLGLQGRERGSFLPLGAIPEKAFLVPPFPTPREVTQVSRFQAVYNSRPVSSNRIT